jgi:hypothetical protein
MKQIRLKNGKFTKVDDDVFEYLNNPKWTWKLYKGSVIRTTSKRMYDDNGRFIKLKPFAVYIHRVIMNPPKNMFVDHINGDVLDNRKINLRVCNTQQNNANRGILSNNTSGYKGVSWFKTRNKWRANTWFNNKQIHIGYFNNKTDAAKAVDNKNIELFGQFARLNIPPSLNI